jgi:hypothetical protein
MRSSNSLLDDMILNILSFSIFSIIALSGKGENRTLLKLLIKSALILVLTMPSVLKEKSQSVVCLHNKKAVNLPASYYDY